MTTNKVQEILKRLQKLHPETIELGLERTFSLLQKLENPQNALPPVLHIAGTNGKGSTLSFIQAILEDAGLSVHRYTSPELIRFNERYIINGREISDTDLVQLLEEVEKINAGEPITFFEITTVCAFKVFAENPADVVLLETGLGGRLDSTNVVQNTAVNIITSISKDHEVFLGNTPAKIAVEKAGILRKNTPAIIAPQTDIGAINALKSYMQNLGTIGYFCGESWSYDRTHTGFIVKFDKKEVVCTHPNLVGDHQYENASTAIMACNALRDEGLNITTQNMQNGITKAVHRGRFEHIKSGLADIFPSKDIYLDGGHNPAAAKAIKTSLEKVDAKKITLVCGMLEGKDTANFIAPIHHFIDNVICVPVQDNPFSTAPGQNPKKLAQSFVNAGISNVLACPDLDMAIQSLKDNSQDIVLFAGSLHLVGDVLNLDT